MVASASDTEIFSEGQLSDWIADTYLVQMARELIILAEGIEGASDRSPRFYGRMLVHMATHNLHRVTYGATQETQVEAVTELLKGVRDGLTVQDHPQPSGGMH